MQSSEFKTKKYNIIQLRSKEEFLESLSMDGYLSSGEILLMALKYSQYNKLTLTVMSNLFRLINIILGEKILPETRFTVEKLLNNKLM